MSSRFRLSLSASQITFVSKRDRPLTASLYALWGLLLPCDATRFIESKTRHINAFHGRNLVRSNRRGFCNSSATSCNSRAQYTHQRGLGNSKIAKLEKKPPKRLIL